MMEKRITLHLFREERKKERRKEKKDEVERDLGRSEKEESGCGWGKRLREEGRRRG